jgi:hypothetical protein
MFDPFYFLTVCAKKNWRQRGVFEENLSPALS